MTSTPAAPTTALPALRLPLGLYPGLNRFALDLVQGAVTATSLVRRVPAESLRVSRTPRGSDELVSALTESNQRWGNDVGRELARWRQGEGLSLVAGQQVCFAGGPLLIPVKLASLLHLRDELRRHGVTATVFFWLATEDHDYDEVASITVPTRSGGVRLRAEPRAPSRRMVGRLPVDEGLREGLLDLLGIEPPSWLREGITYGDSFAELLSEVFAGQGVVFVDAMLPELRREGRELFRAMIANMDAAERRVTERSSTIAGAGYSPQVVPSDDGHYSFLYHVDDEGVRQPIRIDGGEWTLGGRRSSIEEISGIVEHEPHSISTGVLARPLLQDHVLATDIFIGGPSEISYYAQLVPLHEMFEIRQPHVGLRAHLLAAATRTLKAIDDYGLAPEDLFRSPEEVIGRLDPSAAAGVRDAIESSEKRVDDELGRIKATILSTDPQLERSVERTVRRIHYHLEKLRTRGERAAMRKNTQRYNSISRVTETLFPEGAPQDRSTAWISLWLQYRAHLVERLIEQVEPDSPVLKVVGL